MRTKTNEKEVPITQHRSGTEICPVLAWGSLVYRITSYKNSHLDLPVNTFKPSKNAPLYFITQKGILQHIQSTVSSIGKDKLGFIADEVGTHSIRSSFAMQLYLQNESVYTIMLQGRWKSDSFLSPRIWEKPKPQDSSCKRRILHGSQVKEANLYPKPS